jgi:hypothetical protein
MSMYCKENELLTGDMAGVEGLRQRFVDLAADEMNSFIGFAYLLPLPVDSLPEYQRLILKNINIKLATGRLIMAQAVGSEDTSTHAYGQSLVDEAMRDLWAIRNGQTNLDAPTAEANGTNAAPVIIEGDRVSAVDAYYAWAGATGVSALFGTVPIWSPGSD